MNAKVQSGPVTREVTPQIARLVVAGLALVWAVPFWWMLVAAFRPAGSGADASLLPSLTPTLANFAEAWASADFPLYFLNSLAVCAGILVVQLVTASLAGYVFARLEFPGRGILFALFLVQLMLVPVVLLVPNLKTVAALGLYDTLPGVMAPYFATAFGTFLMRQSFREVPRELEDAAMIDGAGWWARIRLIYLPLTKPALVAFSIVSVTSHWNEFLWPLMVINSPDRRPLTLGLASFTLSAEGMQAWGLIAAGTFLVSLPLLAAFLIFQRRFVNSFLASGIK
ncbi:MULTISPECIES: carbohydrate ABC transporter permease [Methylobacterium]|jgi:sn-glycerol 3-phosphate transport system permease protein|uniref:ABC transporter permease n=2 Tax=Methylobacterium TaxID=407 RepID=A0A0C6FDA6_9HYPH|nr:MULTISPECIES: carbohydrate ABC transporter permease [Methylobacterium]MBZ6416554.1 carbohydrate ABC transporter permease [Methylobacterium sp.]MBK3397592.1 carbohydrate ABC transporter permease [Methylobacterium ajmalii]MBK3411623.1 carbohydrate ABC transporter permease [Methylobacterium ajmalii]MBK3423410.1 carbohydrate ABC transporter permease [Methylobacterium ajmalii]SFF49125.1 carbohydrate ABC transporter membrane protein 2, CUT1 family [Methylobacterium sp. yr596]